jgi:hypothetical protein
MEVTVYFWAKLAYRSGPLEGVSHTITPSNQYVNSRPDMNSYSTLKPTDLGCVKIAKLFF